LAILVANNIKSIAHIQGVFVLKKFLNIFFLLSVMLLAACNVGKTDATDASNGSGSTTTYEGTYNGSVSGVNSGSDAKIVVGSDNSVNGTWTITNRGDDGKGSYVTTFKGSIDANGNIKFDGTFRGLNAMTFTGKIDLATGAMTGTWFEKLFPEKGGAFSLTRVGGSTNTTGSSAAGCTGSFVGNVNPPPKDVRIAARNRYLKILGKPITGNDAIDNRGTGGGGVDGGMYLQGTFKWETDANCKVIKGVTILHGHTFSINGTVPANKVFTLSFPGPIVGKVDANNIISGQVQEPGRTWVYGDMVGTFVKDGKI
jgi:hypothetical protein